MSDEVQVDQGQTNGMWRLAWRGFVDFLDDQPTPQEITKFKEFVRAEQARRRAEASFKPHERANSYFGGIQIQEKP